MKPAADPSNDARHVILYDGVCGVCNRFNRFVIDRDPRRRFAFAPLQSDLARALLAPHGRTPDDLATVFVFERAPGGSTRLHERSSAILFVLRELGGVWRALSWSRVAPRALRDAAYDAFAARRYRLLGRSDTCPLPKPGDLERFLST